MIERRWLALLVCISILSVGCNKKEETVYQGKPLGVWISMLKDNNPIAKYAAIQAIGEIGPEAREAIPILIQTIRETRNRDRRALFACNKALLAMGKETVPSMVALLKDDDWEMRRGSAWMLGKLGSEAQDAVPALAEASNDTNAAVRMSAQEALKMIKGERGELEKPDAQDSISAEK